MTGKTEPTMSHDTEFLAHVLRTGSRAYAAYAANDLLGSNPEAKVGFGADPLSVWQNWMAVRVEELAAAVAVEQPRLFTSQVHWGKDCRSRMEWRSVRSFMAGMM